MKNERNKSVMIIRNVSIENAAKTLHLGSSYGIRVGILRILSYWTLRISRKR